MQFWLDTIDLNLIEEAKQRVDLVGVTTNPKILSKSEIKPEDKLKQILNAQEGLVAAQIIADDLSGMLSQGRKIGALDQKRMVVKIPVTPIGLQVIKTLSAEGITTLGTTVYETSQVYLAAIAGAQFVSPYLGRMEDHHINAFSLLEEMLDIIDIHMFPLKLLAASIRSKEQIIKCAKLGVPAITIPEAAYKLLLSTHELTTASLEEFNLHWRDGKHTKDSKIF